VWSVLVVTTLISRAGSVTRAALKGRPQQAALTIVLLVLGSYLASANKVWPFVINGISDGSIYALAALGLVLTFKTSGIFNLAIGGQAAASAYVFYSFRIDAGLPWPVAALLALLIVGIGGSLILERMAYLLAEAPPVMKIVATIGLLVFLQSLLTGAYGPATLQFSQYLPTESFAVGEVNVQAFQVIITVFALLSTAGLYLYFKRARLGVAMQAVVEDPNLLALEATSPIVVRRYAWAIGSSFVSISGMLIAPGLGIQVNQMLLLYVTAFGAAALGGFSSLPLTFASAIGIGITMNILSDKLAGQTDVVLSQLYTQVPFLVLVAALLLVPRRKLIERGAKRARRAKPIRRLPANVLLPGTAVLVAAAVMVPFVVDTADINQYTTAVGFAIVLASLGLLIWTSGQLSLCQMAFAAVGATTFYHAQSSGWPWLLALLAGALVAIPVGAIVSIPSFRLTGTYLAVATFGFGLLFQNLIYATDLMFGPADIRSVSRPQLFGLDTDSDRGYYFTALAIGALCAGLILTVRRSRLGRLLRGLGDSPAALAAHATNTRVTALLVFSLSAFLAAVGGVIIAGVPQSASGNAGGSFGYFNSLVLVAVLTFCGRRPILSPVLAAVLFVVIRIYEPFNSEFFTDYQGAIFGALALGVAIFPALRVPTLGRRGVARVGRRTPMAVRAQRLREGAAV
jgi:branched-subunit amino acid ABC-type transport system permease component